MVLVHGDEQVGQALKLLHEMIRELFIDATASREVRADVAPDELARYCIHALAAARHAPSDTAVERIVTVTLDGLRPTT